MARTKSDDTAGSTVVLLDNLITQGENFQTHTYPAGTPVADLPEAVQAQIADNPMIAGPIPSDIAG